MLTKIGLTRGPGLDLQDAILRRMRRRKPFAVWTAADFVNTGSRAAVDKALQRLVEACKIRRIARGLYDVPAVNRLTGKPTHPDYTSVIDAVARRDQARMLLDGLTAANQLGLSDAVPSQITIHTDARLRPIRLGNLKIVFKITAPSRLYWAGRPAMRVVQALHWLRDLLQTDRRTIVRRLKRILADPTHGDRICRDLIRGFATLPIWMQKLVRQLLKSTDHEPDMPPKP
jgi:hypothetical protein